MDEERNENEKYQYARETVNDGETWCIGDQSEGSPLSPWSLQCVNGASGQREMGGFSKDFSYSSQFAYIPVVVLNK